jgi:hypothetical protein
VAERVLRFFHGIATLGFRLMAARTVPPWLFGMASASLSVLLFLFASALFRPDHFHVYGFDGRLNDTAEYISTAKWIADHGTFRHQTLIPSYAENPQYRYYMPGHYLLMALSFWLFGYGALQSIVPSVIAYFLTVALVFLMTEKLLSTRAACYVSAAYALFPAQLAYSMTSMMESVFVATSMLCIYLSYAVPLRWLGVLTPLFVATPFLVRETGLLLIVFPVLRLLAAGAWRYRWTIVAAIAGTAIMLRILYLFWYGRNGIDINSNSWLGGGSLNYTDAFAAPYSPTNAAEHTWLILKNLYVNLIEIGKSLGSPYPFFSLYFLVVIFLLGCALLILKSSWISGNSIPAATVTVFLLTITACMGFYTMSDYVGIRMLIHLVPMLFIVTAMAVARLVKSGAVPSKVKSIAVLILMAVYIFASLRAVTSAAMEVRRNDQLAAEEVSLLKDIGLPSSDRLLVSPVHFGLAYVVDSPPRRHSIIPENVGTLKLLENNFGIDAMILPMGADEALVDNAVYQRSRELVFRGDKYLIWTPRHQSR